MYRVTLFEGDGIGPEITTSVKEIIEAAGVQIEWEQYLIGENAYLELGTLIPDEALQSIKKTKVVLKAPVTTPLGVGFRSVNVALRQQFNLYVNLRPSLSLVPHMSRYENIDLITIRENTEDLYIGEERKIDGGYEAIKRITQEASERIIRYAFEYAIKYNRKKVTCVHKANILKKTDGLFLSLFNEIKKEYPSIQTNDKIVDNMCMQLVMNPHQFDVIVCPNLYGDIISDLIAGLSGGLGLAPSANIGTDLAMFEAVHGSAPDIANKGIANPIALLLSATLMLEHLGEKAAANNIRNAVETTLQHPSILTPDLGGNGTTKSLTNEIIKHLKQSSTIQEGAQFYSIG